MPPKQNTKYFIKKAKIIHGNTFSYEKVNYINNRTKVIIICKFHGEFEQRPDGHLAGRGCVKCSHDIKRSNTKDFIIKAKLIHGNRYNYKLVKYKKRSGKIQIICNRHTTPYIFKQTVGDHLKGRGCNRCFNRISKKEIKWLDSLNIKDLKRQFKIPNTRLQVDGFHEKTNTVYEFHGDYWHGNPDVYDLKDINKHNKKTFGELYRDTLLKEKEIRSLGYNLVVMWENDCEI